MSFISIIRQARYEESSNLYSRAFNSYAKAISLTNSIPAKIRLESNRAWCLHKIGNFDQAIEMFNSLIKNYDHAESFLLAGLYYYKTGKLKSSKNFLQKGIEKFPDYLELYITLSSILKDTERTNESIEILKKALSRENLIRGKGGILRKDIWAELGTLYYERGNFNSCILCLKKSMNMDIEENFLHYPLLAKSYLILGDPKNSLLYIEKQLLYFQDLDQDDYITKARAHSRLEELHLASACLLQAHDSDGILRISSEEMIDFSTLMQNGFFNTIENLQIGE